MIVQLVKYRTGLSEQNALRQSPNGQPGTRRYPDCFRRSISASKALASTAESTFGRTRKP